MSETDERDEEALVFNLDRGEIKREETHHRDRTKGGRTLDRHGGLLVSCQSRGSAKPTVNTNVPTIYSHTGAHLVNDL